MPLQLRLAALFCAAALLLVGAGGFFFVRELRAGLVSSLDASLTDRAALTVKALADEENDKVPNLAKLVAPAPNREPPIAEVLVPPGRIVASTGLRVPRPLLSAGGLGRAETRLVFSDGPSGGRGAGLRLLAERVPGKRQLVLVLGASLATIDQAAQRATTEALVGGAIIVVLAALGAWLLARGALRPVERMRAQAAEISGHDPDARLPVPATRDEIAALANTMNDLLDRLQQALAAQRAFVQDAGHELRTPLAVLGAELELASHPGRSRQDLAEAVVNAREETERLAKLARDLLLIASADGADAYLQREPTDVRALLFRTTRAWQSRAIDRGVHLATEAPSGVVVELDGDRIRQSLDNLVDNALRWAPPDTTVTVSGRVEGDVVRISVSDQGPGFPVDFLPHAFERFRRPDSARASDDGGTGLGLAIVAALAAAHGGRVEAVNGAGGGAAVTLTLPVQARLN